MRPTTYQIFNWLLEVNQCAAIELIKTYFNESGKDTSLIFAKNRNGELRVSEQELRFAMINFLNPCPPKLNWTVETPTENLYSFNGDGFRSGSSDLSFYDENDKILNVELKGGNPEQFCFNKDVEKLVHEPCYGAWCHILENEDSGTLKSIFNKLKIALELAINKYNGVERPLYFSFLILKKRKLITRLGKDTDILNFSPDIIFDLKYDDHRELSCNRNENDWHLNYYGEHLLKLG